MAANLAQDLLDMKEKVDTAKTDKTRIEGERNQLLKQAEEGFGVKDLKGIDALIKSKTEEVQKLDTQFSDAVVALKENYNWGA
jgi:hypothetical protein